MWRAEVGSRHVPPRVSWKPRRSIKAHTFYTSIYFSRFVRRRRHGYRLFNGLLLVAPQMSVHFSIVLKSPFAMTWNNNVEVSVSIVATFAILAWYNITRAFLSTLYFAVPTLSAMMTRHNFSKPTFNAWWPTGVRCHVKNQEVINLPLCDFITVEIIKIIYLWMKSSLWFRTCRMEDEPLS